METHLRNFEDIQEEDQRLTPMLEMNRPGNKCAVIRRCPGVGCEAEAAIVFLNTC
jgi:hypothetical protein